MELQKLISLVDLLMAAASQDGEIGEEEIGVIQGYLDEMGMIEEDDRAELEDHMSNFDPDEFDFDASIEGLGELDDDERAAVISLLEMVEEADGVIDLGESDFIAQVAAALGASEEEIDALSVDVIDGDDDELPEPPPLPEGEEEVEIDDDEDSSEEEEYEEEGSGDDEDEL